MGWKLNPELEAQCLAMAAPRDGVVSGPVQPPTFKDEAEFQAAVIKQARAWGWLVYHTYDSRRSEEGFPDLLMLRRDRQIAAELKRSSKEKLSRAQQKWAHGFQAAGGKTHHYYVWSPENWDFILHELS